MLRTASQGQIHKPWNACGRLGRSAEEQSEAVYENQPAIVKMWKYKESPPHCQSKQECGDKKDSTNVTPRKLDEEEEKADRGV